MPEENSYKSVYEILKTPLADLRVEVSDKFFSSKLTKQDFIDYCSKLVKSVEKFDGVSTSELAKEIQNAYQFIKNGKSATNPNVKDSLHQFVWGLALACSICDKEIKQKWRTPEKDLPLHKFEVWQQIKESAPARAELRRHAFMITKMPFMQEDIKMKWGSCNYPNVGYYYNKEGNKINLDLLWALIGGFEHSRAAQLHEIGHSQGTLVYTPEMQRIEKEYSEINKKVREGNASKEEYHHLKILKKEYDFRFSMFDEAENSYANRFATNASDFGRVRQDIGYDLNSIETQLFQVGKNVRQFEKQPQKLKDSPANRAYNLKQAIRYSFFVNNEIISDDTIGWKNLGVNIDWIEYSSPDGKHLKGQEAFDKLREMTSMLEKLQLKERDYHKSEQEIYNISLDYSKKRGEVIDQIYECFAKEYFDEYLKQLEKNDQQNNKESDKQNQDSLNQNNGESGVSQEQSGEGNGESGVSQEQSSEGNGEKKESHENNENTEYDIFNDTPDELIEDEEDINNKNSQNQPELGNAKSRKGENADDTLDDTDEDQPKRNYDDLTDEEKQNLVEDENGNIVKNEMSPIFDDKDLDDEDMIPLADLFENPEEELKAMIEKLEEGIEDDDDAEDIIDIIRTPIEQEDAEERKISNQYHNSDSVKIGAFPKTLMPENEFSKIVEKNFDMIEHLKLKFEELQNRYYDENPEAESLSSIPDSGNFKVDIPSYIERLKKQITGEELKEKDFENFVVNGGANEEIKAPIDIAVLIDTSGSMHGAGTHKFAIEMGCTLFQATRDNPAFNVYVALMSSPTTWVAKPGENSIEISQRLASIESLGIGDDEIGDNIMSVLKEVKERETLNKAEGLTNFFMITDGGHTDSDVSFPLVEKAIESDVPATFNWVLTVDKDESWASELIDKHQSGIGSQRIDYADEVNKDNMLDKIMSLIEKRVDDIKEIEAMKTKEKTDSIDTFLTALNTNNGGRKW